MQSESVGKRWACGAQIRADAFLRSTAATALSQIEMAKLLRWYRTPGESAARETQLVAEANAALVAAGGSPLIESVASELCFYVELEAGVQLADLTLQRALARWRTGNTRALSVRRRLVD